MTSEAYRGVLANDIKVKGVLNGRSVSAILHVPYLSFGRQLWKLSREQDIQGHSLQLAAEVLRLKWKDRGLDEEVLLAIQQEVCSVQPEPWRRRRGSPARLICRGMELY